jgi:hypothetical protein
VLPIILGIIFWTPLPCIFLCLFIRELLKPKDNAENKENTCSQKRRWRCSCSNYDEHNPFSTDDSQRNHEDPSRHHDDSYRGVNPASGLPLRSPGIDMAGNSMGSSSRSTSYRIW